MSTSSFCSKLAVTLLTCLMFIGSAQAENPVFTSLAYANAANPILNGYCSDCGGVNQHVADQFTLKSATTLTSTDFAIASYFGSNWNIEVTIYDSNMNLLYSHVNTAGSYGISYAGNEVNIIHAGISGLTLGAGNYYMGWYDPAGMSVPAYAGGDTMVTIPGDSLGTVAAFQINAVPEPETYAMLLAGLALIAGLKRRSAAKRA